MSTQFDYFLILTFFAVVAVMVLFVNLLKSSHQKDQPKHSLNSSNRIERIGSRSASVTDSATRAEKPRKAPRITSLVFYDLEKRPVAVLSRTTLGAQPWGRRKEAESLPLTLLITRYLKPSENESITLHYPLGNPHSFQDILSIRAFDENGLSLAFEYPLSIRGEDFPVFDTTENLQTWLIQTPLSIYRQLFLRLGAVEQVHLLKLELTDCQTLSLTFWQQMSNESKVAVINLLLYRLALAEDFFTRMQLYNRFTPFIHGIETTDDDPICSLERLIISQTFVQKQKLPFFLIRTSSPTIQWSKALKY